VPESDNDPIRDAIRQLRRLPGIGEKTATRLVYWLLRDRTSTAPQLAEALARLPNSVVECEVCCNWSSSTKCRLCTTERRDDLLCVVEEPVDVLAMERSGEFQGRYHILHGSISPLEGRTPDQLRIRSLLERLRSGQVKEVIVATNPNVEGDATALYLARLLESIEVTVSRLAHGISVGTEIEYASAVSLARALQNRRTL
jgi:recombination protein RecR